MSLTIRPLRREDVEGCLRVIASLPRFFAVSDTDTRGADEDLSASERAEAGRMAAQRVGAHHRPKAVAARSAPSAARATGVHPVRSGRHGAPDESDPAPGVRSIAQAAKDLGTQGGLVAVGPGGDVLGFLTWKRHGDHAAEITWMAVHSQLRHRGVGTTLLNRLERLLATQGFQNISALTSAFSHTYEPTRQFWRGRGYAPVLQLDDLWETDVALVLTKTLTP
jgi:GNAT superfamily N-acetyltransferase